MLDGVSCRGAIEAAEGNRRICRRPAGRDVGIVVRVVERRVRDHGAARAEDIDGVRALDRRQGLELVVVREVAEEVCGDRVASGRESAVAGDDRAVWARYLDDDVAVGRVAHAGDMNHRARVVRALVGRDRLGARLGTPNTGRSAAARRVREDENERER